MYGALGAVVGHDAARLGGVAQVGCESVLPVPLAQVAFPPDAGTDPDSDNGDHHDDEEDDPLVVIREPGGWQQD